MMAGVLIVFPVTIRQVVTQILLRSVFVRAALLDFQLLMGGRAEIAMLYVLALFLFVVIDTALVLTDLIRIVVHVLIVLRVRQREHQQRAECACYQGEYEFLHKIISSKVGNFYAGKLRPSLIAFATDDAGPMPELLRAH
jgi:hypothetical protein